MKQKKSTALLKMLFSSWCSILVFSLMGSLIIACQGFDVKENTRKVASEKIESKREREPIKVLVPPNVEERMAALGGRLFHDPRLSKDGSISCASCHGLNTGGVDNRRVSTGINNGQGNINSPTVYNSGNSFRQFWDGRAKTLEDQIEGPIHAALEMGSTWEDIIKKLSADERYTQDFLALFGGEITSKHIKKAIADFERSLITPSRFDDYLAGNDDAITETEKKGYKMFKNYGCISCHQGVNIGGNMFQRLGITDDYFEDRGGIVEADYGRYNVTKNELDKYMFKVPSLRNVELTAPYFHDGSKKTLSEAVNTMIYYQLGRDIPQEDVDLLIKFLKTLTGKDLK